MAKERLGKVEKWILTHCYLKTVKKQLPDDWKVARKFCSIWDDDDWPNCTLKKARDGGRLYDSFWDCLYKYEVMLNYFGLERAKGRHVGYDEECFKGHGWFNPMPWSPQKGYEEDAWDTDRKRVKAHVTFTRVRRSLVSKGLITVNKPYEYISPGPNALGIMLTEEGKAKAEKILNINGAGKGTLEVNNINGPGGVNVKERR